MMIPKDFESWKKCIEIDCGISLTTEFVRQRVAVYADEQEPETQRFIKRYGAEHHQHILKWFRKVAEQHETKWETKR